MKHVSMLLGIVWMAVAGLGGGCMSVDLGSLLNDTLDEVTLEDPGGWGVDKILVVDISGMLSGKGEKGFGSEFTCTPDYLKAILRKAEADSRIKGVILRVDSPGGEITPTDIMARELKQFAARKVCPVYSVIMGTGASGAYYLSCATERIYAHPSAVVGSIGVIAAFPQVVKLADKIGVDLVVVKSGALKDMGSMMRPMTEEEETLMQSLIDSFYKQFTAVVLAGRRQIAGEAALKPLADGRVFTARQALDAKLIDKIGYLDDAMKDIKEACGLEKAQVITYTYRASDDANIYSPVAHGRLPSMEVKTFPVELPRVMSRPGFYYLWQPGW